MGGPLGGIRVIELAGIGPGPFCAMLLADLGADVVRIDRPPHASSGLPGPLNTLVARNKRSIAIDLKDERGRSLALDLVAGSDVLIEGFRPGVAERLGLGPEACHERNPALIYGRVTGWGRDGPLADRAGHDINYIGLVGALHAVGAPDGPPVVPLNLLADYGGGALYLAMGVLAALIERSRSGRGDVVDAAMIDGAASLMLPTFEMFGLGVWSDRRGANLLDGGAPFYGVYEAADGGYLAVGPIEQQFFAAFIDRLGIEPEGDQYDAEGWAALRARIEEVFSTRPRDAWVHHFDGVDACVTPVLSLAEAPDHEHHRARGTFVEVDGVLEPAPAPRFARSATSVPGPPPQVGQHAAEVLAELGLGDEAIAGLLTEQVVLDASSGGQQG